MRTRTIPTVTRCRIVRMRKLTCSLIIVDGPGVQRAVEMADGSEGEREREGAIGGSEEPSGTTLAARGTREGKNGTREWLGRIRRGWVVKETLAIAKIAAPMVQPHFCTVDAKVWIRYLCVCAGCKQLLLPGNVHCCSGVCW